MIGLNPFDVDQFDDARTRNRTRTTTQHRASGARAATTTSGDLVWPLTLTLFVVCLVMAIAAAREARRWAW